MKLRVNLEILPHINVSHVCSGILNSDRLPFNTQGSLSLAHHPTVASVTVSPALDT